MTYEPDPPDPPPPPSHVVAEVQHLMCNMSSDVRGGGVIGLIQNLMKKEWADMCVAAYTPAALADKTKIRGFT